MAKTILFIHGRSFKPAKPALSRLWKDATRYGIERSFSRKVGAFDAAKKVFVYYGDISNDYLRRLGRKYNERKDVEDRKHVLEVLKTYTSRQFTKARYDKLPGKTPLKEFFADTLSGPLKWLGLSEKAIASVAPDMREYWNPDSQFGSDVRWPFTEALRRAMDGKDKILVVAHSLGTMIAWDTFWKFSYYGEYQRYRGRRVDLWITLGSPLADETVKAHLKGAGARGSRQFPATIVHWENVAAEDDYISHDQTVKNDFKRALRYPKKLAFRSIQDHRIYNLTVRREESNPHSSLGYRVHPKTAELIGKWL